ncbi:hypothetical protein A7D16_08940 [Xanthomonas nasturtii]|nr:hypothetical protein A7D16_08940 [Xanthomonas nasturtii]RFF38618.1 hypothetical protein DZD52_12115 [Xanthomonas nasturtii]
MDFPEGRARFSGGIRGADELRHDTFAIEIDGKEYFGEINRDWHIDDTHYDLAIVSFGFSLKLQVGMPVTASSARAFTDDEIELLKNLVVHLIETGVKLEDKPSVISDSSGSIFTGKIAFTKGWALIKLAERAGDH